MTNPSVKAMTNQPDSVDAKLKPCPFCGYNAMRLDGGFFGFFVRCSNLNCKVLCSASSSTSMEETENAWNTRAPDKALIEQVVRMAVELRDIEGDVIVKPSGWNHRSRKYTPDQILAAVLKEVGNG